MAHSPGPWQYKQSLICGFKIQNALGLDVAMLADDWIHKSTEDNAKLIAAAPELLDALENLLYRIASEEDTAGWFPREQEDARKAIAKAGGA